MLIRYTRRVTVNNKRLISKRKKSESKKIYLHVTKLAPSPYIWINWNKMFPSKAVVVVDRPVYVLS